MLLKKLLRESASAKLIKNS